MGFDPRGLITVNDVQVQAAVQNILASRDDVRTDFRRIQDWVAANVVYDTNAAGHWQWPSETLNKKRGNCKDYSTLLCTLWRASGVPAKDVYVAVGQSRDSIRHAFLIEKFMSGKWYVVEPQVGGFILSDLFAADTAETYAITCLFNDIEYITGSTDIMQKIRGVGVTVVSRPTAKKSPPVVNSFSVNRESVPAGGSVVLSWDVVGATYVGINQGIGGVDPSGIVSVSPAETTEYTLAAMNDEGFINATVKVGVIPVTYPESPSQVIPYIDDTQKPFMIGFAGWYRGKETVSTVNVGQQVVARFNLKGGSAGRYFLRVWRAINTGHDEIVMQSSFINDGISAVQEIAFSPSYAIGEAGTRGYWVDVQANGEQVWTMPNAYPPRLTAIPRPQAGQLEISFIGWYMGIESINKVRKGQEITTGVTLAGGSPGQYTLYVKRDATGLNDEIVEEVMFDYNSTSALSEIKFIPELAQEESGTRGYYLELHKDGKYLWSLGGSYPPRLVVTH